MKNWLNSWQKNLIVLLFISLTLSIVVGIGFKKLKYPKRSLVFEFKYQDLVIESHEFSHRVIGATPDTKIYVYNAFSLLKGKLPPYEIYRNKKIYNLYRIDKSLLFVPFTIFGKYFPIAVLLFLAIMFSVSISLLYSFLRPQLQWYDLFFFTVLSAVLSYFVVNILSEGFAFVFLTMFLYFYLKYFTYKKIKYLISSLVFFILVFVARTEAFIALIPPVLMYFKFSDNKLIKIFILNVVILLVGIKIGFNVFYGGDQTNFAAWAYSSYKENFHGELDQSIDILWNEKLKRCFKESGFEVPKQYYRFYPYSTIYSKCAYSILFNELGEDINNNLTKVLIFVASNFIYNFYRYIFDFLQFNFLASSKVIWIFLKLFAFLYGILVILSIITVVKKAPLNVKILVFSYLLLLLQLVFYYILGNGNFERFKQLFIPFELIFITYFLINYNSQ